MTREKEKETHNKLTLLALTTRRAPLWWEELLYNPLLYSAGKEAWENIAELEEANVRIFDDKLHTKQRVTIYHLQQECTNV